MIDWTTVGPSVLAAFMASMVEFVEALTIVLAVGVVRGWRSALLGTVAGLVVLGGLVAILGRSLAGVPLPVLQLVVGILLLMFGLRWLRKAILRASGVLALHDEAQAFAKETESLRRLGGVAAGIDKIAFLTTFKAVVLEGMEVVFIVIALGADGRFLVPAAVGAGLALTVVVALGLVLHRPLANVPENTLKFGVGVMLSAFGTFWAGEGIGLEWPGHDWILLALIAGFLAVALGLVAACKHWRDIALKSTTPAAGKSMAVVPPGAVETISGELFGLFVDDGWLAAGVLAWVFGGWWLLKHQQVGVTMTADTIFVAGLLVVLAFSALRRAQMKAT
ncbi:MAG: hypothetical protein ABI893_00395 [Polaromonas sp.]|uniref:COG4280 domain-containing protein n=1 Tax=Polaromonas sp. TaxID=1869339 RepID=UPI003262F060